MRHERTLQFLASNTANAGYPEHARFLPQLARLHGLPIEREIDGVTLSFQVLDDGEHVCVDVKGNLVADATPPAPKGRHGINVNLPIRWREMIREEGGGSITKGVLEAVAMYLRKRGRKL